MSEARIVRTKSVPVPGDTRAEIVASFDGAPIRVLHFGGAGERGDALIVPGWAEPAEKYAEVALDLIDRGFRVVAYDPRGQGLSLRLSDGDERGRIDDFTKHVKDLGAVVDHLSAERLTILAHSLGGLATLSWLAEGGKADCVVLSAPATRIFPSMFQRGGVRALTGALKRFGLGDLPLSKEGGQSNEFDGNTLTHDPERFRMLRDLIDEEPGLRLPRTTPHFVSAIHRAQSALHRAGALAAVTTPIRIVTLPDDRWVNSRDHAFFAARYPDIVSLTTVEGSNHEILMEADEYRDQFWDAFDAHADAYAPGREPVST